jgi:alpha-ketoglutarate-dependent taurine dioxygenase
MRSGDPALARLRPVGKADAHPKSISAVHGLGPQPLHTDGAHLAVPPNIIVLTAETPNETPTKLWKITRSLPSGLRCAHSNFEHGMFLVANGLNSFFASAWAPVIGHRYDPVCMSPCDARAREVASYFEEAGSQAVEHSWEHAGQILVIHNHAVLHGRGAVDEVHSDRELIRLGFHVETTR